MRTRTFLESKYHDIVAPMLCQKYDIKNIHMVPSITKVVVSMRLGRDASDKKAIDAAMQELAAITCQKPNYAKAKKSIAGFHVRQGQIVGTYTTLRGVMAYEFLERLIYMALPRIRDFKGYSSKSFDKQYNLTIGIKEHLVFQELTYDKIYKSRGLDICINSLGIKSVDMGIDLFRGLMFPIRP